MDKVEEEIVIKNEEENGEMDEDEKEGKSSRILRSSQLKSNEGLMKELFPGIETFPAMIEHVVKKYGDRELYFWRKVVKEHIERDLVNKKDLITLEYGKRKSLSYNEVHKMIRGFASGLVSWDKNLKKGSKVGIYMNTSKEWIIAFQGIMQNAMAVVTVYANLGYEGLKYCINQCEIETIICECSNIKNIDDQLFGSCPTLKNLVVVGESLYHGVTKYTSKNFNVVSMYDLVVEGEKNPVKLTPPTKDDIAVIMYTSGTTGNPKGVMMSHGNFCSAMAGGIAAVDINDKDTYLSYLPLAHGFELLVNHAMILSGAKIGFANPRTLTAKRGGAKKLGDLDFVRPTVMVAVPRIKKGIMYKLRAAGWIKQKLFQNTLKRKQYYLDNDDGKIEDVCLEGITFGKIRKMVGGRLRLMISGGAPLSSETQHFLQNTLGSSCKVVQLYGLTETLCGTIQPVQLRTKCTIGNVGFPFPNCEMKLVDAKEMGYLVSDNPSRGEIWIRGPPLTQGYYKMPKQTKEVYLESGWFKTGDIGVLNKDGSVSIIDRIKNLVKLSQGEFIAPSYLEAIYGSSDFVSPNGICVIASSFKTINTIEWAKGISDFSEKDIDELIKEKKLKKAVLYDFQKIAKRFSKKGFEIIKDLILVNGEWTPDNGMLTAAHKLKRRVIHEKYSSEITEIYGVEIEKPMSPLVKKDGGDDDDDDDADDVPKYFYQIKPDHYTGFY